MKPERIQLRLLFASVVLALEAAWEILQLSWSHGCVVEIKRDGKELQIELIGSGAGGAHTRSDNAFISLIKDRYRTALLAAARR